nr:fused MFS/spermidine synthase [Rhodoferax sp.]
MPSQVHPSPVPSQWLRSYLLLTAGLCGAIVMVVEVLGSRVIGPFFGVSLFVWTSLITVTLVALALGYAFGGRLADRTESPALLYAIVLAAGLCVLAVPLLQAVVLKACVGLGLRLGSLLASAVLFGPALFLLGCVSPLLVRLLANEMKSLGRTVGGLYALSTAGSFVGTVATGFFLIGVLGVSRIFLLSGALLCALAATYFFAFRRQRLLGLVAMLLPLGLFLIPSDALPSKILVDGTRATVIEKRDSFYGNLRVVDYQAGERHTRELAIDGLIQGGGDVATGLSVYEYPYPMQFLPVALHPDGRSSLVIGLGAGFIARWYAARGIETEVVDIDPAVVDLARKHFNFPATIPVHIEDARHFLAQSKKSFDYIVLDVFNGDTTPGHLLSVEAMRLLAQRLKPQGVLAINLIGSLRRENFMTASVIHTLQTVFDQVQIIPLIRDVAQQQSGNLVVLAYRGAQRSSNSAAYAQEPVHPMARDLVTHALQKRFSFPVDTPAMLLTDDFNPIDLRDLWMKEEVRSNILETTDLDILLG